MAAGKAKATYWQRGETIDYANATEEKIEAGEILTIGSIIGVAGTEIAPGEVGSAHIEGVYYLPKKEAAEIALGAPVCFKDNAVEDFAEGEVFAGIAVVKAETADATVLVKINAGNSAKKE